jgi:apolipoprotein N-acyltransferase
MPIFRWAVLATAALAWTVGLQRYAWAPAAFAGMLLLLYWVRGTSSNWQAWLGVSSAYALAALIVFNNDYLQVPTLLRLAIDLGASMVLALPYVLHRAWSQRLSPVFRWAPLACSWVLLEWLQRSYGPYGSWGSLAYSFTDVLPLMQWAAIGGVGAIVLLVCIVAVWVEQIVVLRGKEALSNGVALIALLATASGYSWMRMPHQPSTDVAHAAAIALDDATYRSVVVGRDMRALAMADAPARALAAPVFAQAHERLLAHTREALAAGATLVVWPETVPTLEEQLPSLIDSVQQLAAEKHAELLITPWLVLHAGEFPYGRNLAIAVDASGERLRFDKGHPVPGMETKIRSGGEVPALWAAQAGLATVAICMDYDFPSYVRAGAAAHPGLLLVPADDWPAVRRVHLDMHRLRAIEMGSSMVRSAHNGRSALIDPYGRILASADSDRDVMLLGDVPRHGVSTLYAAWGEWVEKVCAGMLLVLVLWRLVKWRSFRPLRPPVEDAARIGGTAATG